MDNDIERIAVTDLRFDRKSPRFAIFGNDLPDDELALVEHIYRALHVHPITRSIVVWGFSPEPAEALDVMPDPDNAGAYVVLDGNRRLAAVRVLTATDEDLESIPGLGISGSERDWMKDAAIPDLATLPVRVHRASNARETLSPWIEARHNNGSDRSRWRIDGMARVAVEQMRGGMDHETVARRGGISRVALTKMVDLDALVAILPAAGSDLDEWRLPRPQGLFDALDAPSIREFLGLEPRPYDDPGAVSPVFDPERVRSLCVALDIARREAGFGHEALGEILVDDAARDDLFTNRDVRRARMLLNGSKERFMRSLGKARMHLREALREAAGLVGDETVLDTAQDMRALAIDIERRVLTDDQRAVHAELATPPVPLDD